MGVYDVVIIGAGVSGCAVARYLAKTKRKIAVIEKASDVCEGTSKANSGIVHAGHDAVPGTLKARLNVRGNEMMESLAQELDFPFKRNGSLVLCFEEEGLPSLEELLERGRANGVKGLKILSGEEARELEPKVSKEVVAALYAPAGGIVCPFGLNLALAENACDNGVEFFLNHSVELVERTAGGYRVEAGGREFETKLVVNAAGVYADVLHNMVSSRKMKITPRKGEYCLMDKKAGELISATLFQLPSELGKGILVTPTVHGNLLVGPTAQDIPDREGINTTRPGLEKALQLGSRSMEGLPVKQIITSFAGLRAHGGFEDGGSGEDFIIGEAEDAPGFFDVACIESPGLTCAPAIGEYVAGMINDKYPAPLNEAFQPKRTGIPSMNMADAADKQALIAGDPAFANVVCWCEVVTEGELVNAIHRTLGATTFDGLKRRTRIGMGKCQSGFCAPKAVAILARELGVEEGSVTKSGSGSGFLTGFTKEL